MTDLDDYVAPGWRDDATLTDAERETIARVEEALSNDPTTTTDFGQVSFEGLDQSYWRYTQQIGHEPLYGTCGAMLFHEIIARFQTQQRFTERSIRGKTGLRFHGAIITYDHALPDWRLVWQSKPPR